VRTWGFDMQFDVPADRATITAFINTHVAAQTVLLDGLDRCVTNAVVTVSDDDHAACLSTIDALGAVAAGVTAVDAEERELFDVALGSWRAWQQTLYFYDRDIASTYEARDLQMAENFLTLNGLYDGAAKVVIWAHNFHIAQDHDNVTSGFLAGVPSTGSVLKDVLGDDYTAVALVAGDTGINWPGVGTGPIGYGADPQSVEATLKAFDAPALIVRGDAPVLAGERTIGDMVLDVASNFAVVLYLASSPGMTTSY
jgi:erythromycin esterase-like protein